MKIRTPDYIGIITETEKQYSPFTPSVSLGDITVCAALQSDLLHVELKADETPVKYISLRWNFTETEKRQDTVKVYGDVWESIYCNLEWRGIVPDRMMPWV